MSTITDISKIEKNVRIIGRSGKWYEPRRSSPHISWNTPVPNLDLEIRLVGIFIFVPLKTVCVQKRAYFKNERHFAYTAVDVFHKFGVFYLLGR